MNRLRNSAWGIFVTLLTIASPAVRAADSIDLILNWKAEPEFGGFYTAVQKGFYLKEGLQVRITEGGSGTPTTQMVANSKATFGIASADDVIIANDRGMALRAVFATYQNTPHGIMVRATRKVSSIKDIFEQDGVLALQKGLPYAVFLLNKYPRPKVKIVPYLGGVGNFLADPNYAQQCFVTAEPIEAEKKGVKPKTFMIQDEGFNPYSNVLIVRADTLQNQKDLVARFVRASRQGWLEYLKSPTAANIEMQKLNPSMDLATFELVSQAQIPFIRTKDSDGKTLGMMKDARWNELSNQLAELKLIRKKKTAAEYYQNLQ